MQWFNYIGLIVVALMLAPNIVYAYANKAKGREIVLYKNKVLEVFEQIGRYGSMLFMVFNIPCTYMQFYFSFAKQVYIGINVSLVLIYILCFIIFWKKENIAKAIILSLIPSLIFVFSGVMIASIPLTVFALMFAITHITISIKTAKLQDTSPKRKRNAILTIIGAIFSVVLIIIITTVSLFGYSTASMKKLQGMTAMEMIKYDTYNDVTKISVAVIDNGSITYHTYGNEGEEDKFYDYEIGSISKTYLGLIYAKAISEGEINLSDPISKYLDLDKNKYYPTIERLLTHTSGYKGYYFEREMMCTRYLQKTTNDFYGISKEKILNRVKKIKLVDKDYKFEYSNFGISVLGLVLEEVYQKPFTAILNTFIQETLGLENTTVAKCEGNLSGYWPWKENDGYIPAGSIISTIEDMAAYLNIYMKNSLPYVASATKIIKKVDGTNPAYESMNIRTDSMAMTWVHDDENGITWHNGATGSFNSYIGFSDDKTKGVVILSNLNPQDRISMTAIGARMMLELKGHFALHID